MSADEPVRMGIGVRRGRTGVVVCEQYPGTVVFEGQVAVALPFDQYVRRPAADSAIGNAWFRIPWPPDFQAWSPHADSRRELELSDAVGTLVYAEGPWTVGRDLPHPDQVTLPASWDLLDDGREGATRWLEAAYLHEGSEWHRFNGWVFSTPTEAVMLTGQWSSDARPDGPELMHSLLRGLVFHQPSDWTRSSNHLQQPRRSLMSSIDAAAILRVLADRESPIAQGTWIQRCREHEARLATGDPTEAASVLRDLSLLAEEKELSFPERKLYDRSRALVHEHLAAVRGTDRASVSAEIDAALAAGTQ